MPYSEIIGEYCIGAQGKVKTVMLYSNCPLNEISSIALDFQSRTSVMLVKILVKNFWKIDVKFFDADEDYIDGISKNNAGLVIGDRTFNLKDSFLYKYDLSEEWFKYTNMPFVFACWVANKNLSDKFKQQFSNALKYGVDNKTNVDDQYNKNTNINLNRYLSENISWDFDSQKKAALKKFFSLCRNL
jgi:chorismate dehydratase